MRHAIAAVSLALALAAGPAGAQLGVDLRIQGADIGIHLSTFPTLVQVPGYPVYYDPRIAANYFFYDGLYWVFDGEYWYASSWYDGPWQLVAPDYVPLYLLRVPVRYYRRPPPYFGGWRRDAPPRWGEHWGGDWAQRHGGWDRWNPRAVPPPAPLPRYQQQFSGQRYPRSPEEQAAIRARNYSYRPRDQVAREHFGEPRSRGPSPGAGQATSPRAPQSPPPAHREPQRRVPQGAAPSAPRPQHAPERSRAPGAAGAPVMQQPVKPSPARPPQRAQPPARVEDRRAAPAAGRGHADGNRGNGARGNDGGGSQQGRGGDPHGR